MQTIAWVKLTPETSFYCYEQYVFKKKKLKEYFVYTIWENEVLMFNTVSEYEFIEVAEKILNTVLINL